MHNPSEFVCFTAPDCTRISAHPREEGGCEPQLGEQKGRGGGLTQVVSLGLRMFVDMFLCEAAKEDTVQAGVESVQVDATHVAHARLRLQSRAQC